jgi:hypothetical protein
MSEDDTTGLGGGYTRASKASLLAMGSANELAEAFQKDATFAREYSEELNKLSTTTTGAIQGVKTFSTVIDSWRTIFNATADMVSGNIDELVDLYNAQINVIQTQNRYTQALALQATAVKVYGAGTEQATRASTAASYVGALYTQSKKNETVALNDYITATAKNLATISTSFTEVITSLNLFDIALGTVALNAADSSARMALAAIPLVGGLLAMGIGAYQALTVPHVTAPGMQTGGYVPRTGPYLLHQGETVVPKGGGSGMGNVQITINASSNVDLARVRQEVESALAKTLLQAQRQRGVY